MSAPDAIASPVRPPLSSGKLFALYATFALALVLAWGAYTQHAWEDFYISYRASRHLALGDGLVFQPGERLHTFTSPAHTLLLAAIAKLGGLADRPNAVLWVYRVLGGLALGAALFNLHRLGRAGRWAGTGWVVGLGLMLGDAKSIDFTVAGMEVPLMLALLALHCHALFAGGGWRVLGLSWAGLMWTRPDAFVFIGATLVGALTFACEDAAARRALLGRILRAGALGVACYAPWLIGATLYYGTPVPHTVIAKGLLRPMSLSSVLLSPWELLTSGGFLLRVFGASFVRLVADWGAPLFYFWKTLALVAWLYWLNPFGSRLARAASLSFLLATLYGANVPFAPWYMPGYAMLATIALAGLFSDLWGATAARFGAWRPRARFALVALALAIVGAQAFTCAAMARSMRWQQALNETGNRQPLGLWLHDHARPGDTVFLECVGYIGYYSGLKTHDFPGLTSREMVAARRRLGTNDYGALIAELKPDWLVLRPGESEAIRRARPDLLPTREGGGHYALAATFDRSADVAAVPHLLGRRYLLIDQTFEVYRRNAPAPR